MRVCEREGWEKWHLKQQVSLGSPENLQLEFSKYNDGKHLRHLWIWADPDSWPYFHLIKNVLNKII